MADDHGPSQQSLHSSSNGGHGRLELVTQAITAKLRTENAKLLDQHAETFQEKVLEALMVVLNDEDVLTHLTKLSLIHI